MLAPLLSATSVSSAQAFARDVALDAGDRERAGRLGDRAVVLEDVLDRGADLVGVHQHHLVDVLAREPEGFLADAPHRHAVGEDADALERHALARLERVVHARGVLGFDADRPSTRGYSDFTYAAMPAIRPPPPIGTKIAWMSPGCWRRISMPIVPCPAITSGSSNGWMNIRLRSRASTSACS